ncbi:MAG TPA: patatin-like phospholipase family protein, partial [Noviherbaspirillum sp.]|nr:patatin-like phospholipase family protein [Noviherbaspirillum sp.]
MTDSPIAVHAGPKALAHMREHGMRAADVAVIPAAAGGPKGLIFERFDQWLFGQWLPSAPRERILIGSSIGAWRMAAACQADPAAAFRRLADLYCGQRYPHKPSPQYVSQVSRDFVAGLMSGHEQAVL